VNAGLGNQRSHGGFVSSELCGEGGLHCTRHLVHVLEVLDGVHNELCSGVVMDQSVFSLHSFSHSNANGTTRTFCDAESLTLSDGISGNDVVRVQPHPE